METINQMFKEYLVNFNLFTKLMAEYGFELEKDEIIKDYGIHVNINTNNTKTTNTTEQIEQHCL